MKFSVSIVHLVLVAGATWATALINHNPNTQRLIIRDPDPQAPTIQQVCADHAGSPCNDDEDCYGQPACALFGFPACQCICQLCEEVNGQISSCCKFCSGWGPKGAPDGSAPPWAIQDNACVSNIGS